MFEDLLVLKREGLAAQVKPITPEIFEIGVIFIKLNTRILVSSEFCLKFQNLDFGVVNLEKIVCFALIFTQYWQLQGLKIFWPEGYRA